jgi:antitoxin VapB
VIAMAETTVKRAKLFKNGRSQAVRLPKEFRFEGTEVRIRRSGKCVVLEPLGLERGESNWDSVRREMEKLGPVNAEFAAMVDEEMRKLQKG